RMCNRLAPNRKLNGAAESMLAQRYTTAQVQADLMAQREECTKTVPKKTHRRTLSTNSRSMAGALRTGRLPSGVWYSRRTAGFIVLDDSMKLRTGQSRTTRGQPILFLTAFMKESAGFRAITRSKAGFCNAGFPHRPGARERVGKDNVRRMDAHAC